MKFHGIKDDDMAEHILIEVVKLAPNIKVKTVGSWLIRANLFGIGKKLTAGRRGFEVNKFVAPGLSRIKFKNAHQGLLDRTPIPPFDAEGFVNNLVDITTKVNNHQELSDRIAEAVSTFIWPPDFFNLVIFDPQSAGSKVIIPSNVILPLPIKDLGFDRQGCILDRWASERRLIYIPDARFERRDYFYFIRVPEEIDNNELKVTNARSEKINTGLFTRANDKAYRRKELFPVSMVISPIMKRTEKKVQGLYIAGYSEFSLFGSASRMPDKECSSDKLRYFHLISQAASSVIGFLLQKGGFPQQ